MELNILPETLLFYWNIQVGEGSHGSACCVAGWERWGQWPLQNPLYYEVLTCKEDKSISQVETSKACIPLAFWNEHTGEFNTTSFHSPGKLSVFVFSFYMKVASKVSKTSLSQVFMPLFGFQNTLSFFFPLLISKFFCFSGTSVSYHLEHLEASPKYFQLSSHQDANPT